MHLKPPSLFSRSLLSNRGLPPPPPPKKKQTAFPSKFSDLKGQEAAGKGWLNPCVLLFKSGHVQLSEGDLGKGWLNPCKALVFCCFNPELGHVFPFPRRKFSLEEGFRRGWHRGMLLEHHPGCFSQGSAAKWNLRRRKVPPRSPHCFVSDPIPHQSSWTPLLLSLFHAVLAHRCLSQLFT